jgi:short-subunit dehydrogenase
MRRAVIVGASSGIGAALARVMSADGWELGLVSRRLDLLEELAASLPGPCVVRPIDVAGGPAAMAELDALLAEMDPVDVVVLNAGVGIANLGLAWEPEETTIAVNVTGFAAMANVAWHYFVGKGRGHIVGISSVGKHRAGPTPSYNASKAFVSNYMEALRIKAYKRKLPIAVTDVRPGFVDTPMTRGQKGMFWVASSEVAASQIYAALRKRRRRAYVTRRWAIVAALIAFLPEFLYRKI